MNAIQTDYLDEKSYTNVFTATLSTLKKHAVDVIQLMFGWSWFDACDERQWKSFDVRVDQIGVLLKDVSLESPSPGKFYHDDIYIMVPSLKIEILFCHERDIHLEYDAVNPIVAELLLVFNPYLNR